MTPTIDTQQLPTDAAPAGLWQAAARAVRGWIEQRGVAAADAVLLLPFAELLAPARAALAAPRCWLPRLHTARTLATALGPPFERAPGELSGDIVVDSAAARQLLRGHAWAEAWRARDPLAFDDAVQRLAHTAQTLAGAAAAVHPAGRTAWWARARECATAHAGPGATDRLLLRAAIEWAALGERCETDRLFEHVPSAWIVLTLGSDDPLALGVAHHAAAQGVPVLILNADPPAADPFGAAPSLGALEVVRAADAEAEAMATAWCVRSLLREGRLPLALIAQDRALVRRVRALLERQAIDVIDETGWALATTRAGAHATAALRAVRSGAADDRLDWLKADLGTAADDAEPLVALEKLWRGQRVGDVALRARAEALWQRERARLDAFALPPRRSLGQWLAAFDTLLFGAPHSPAWLDDTAAQQLRRALRLGDAVQPQQAAWAAARTLTMPLDEFSAWVDAALESCSFIPVAPARDSAAVVITPLSRAIGRDFAAVVLPGADANRLGVLARDASLLDESVRRALGLPERAARMRRAALAFVQLARAPLLVALHRRVDGDAEVGPSPWLERLLLARERASAPAALRHEARLPVQQIARSPVARPVPTAGGQLPPSLSASAVEALRQCPYRFFSRTVLHLSEHDELDNEVDKREAGRWLHDTLERFHRARAEPRGADADVAALLACAGEAMAALQHDAGVSPAALLPFSAGLSALARRYVAWLHASEADGWRFEAAEVEAAVELPDAPGRRLHGRIDRVDLRDAGRALRLIDYKMQVRAALQPKVAQPLEDTQLAVYAALQAHRLDDDAQLHACYLALEESEGDLAVVHADVAHSARALVQAIAAERLRIEAGAALPALGEGRVCESCEARGLCRRDHWQALPQADVDAAG